MDQPVRKRRSRKRVRLLVHREVIWKKADFKQFNEGYNKFFERRGKIPEVDVPPEEPPIPVILVLRKDGDIQELLLT